MECRKEVNVKKVCILRKVCHFTCAGVKVGALEVDAGVAELPAGPTQLSGSFSKNRKTMITCLSLRLQQLQRPSRTLPG